ncbi:hypothetical protein, partial [Streptomyces ureilyticus]
NLTFAFAWGACAAALIAIVANSFATRWIATATADPTQRNVPRVPDLPGPSNQGMCDLGRRYGGWQPDSPEAAICKETYGS